jgi:hypothetical protein
MNMFGLVVNFVGRSSVANATYGSAELARHCNALEIVRGCG